MTDAMMVDSKADRVLNYASKEEKKVIKVLLLGTGESGKSTFLKQMQILYQVDAFKSESDKIMYRNIIRRNVLESIQVLIVGALSFEIPFTKTKSEEAAQTLLKVDHLNTNFWNDSIFENIKLLWQEEEAIQRVYEMRSKLQLLDSAQYLLDNIDRIGNQEYSPTKEDVIRSRLRTTGIVETSFVINQVKLKILDVGGQKNERRKWIHAFTEVTCIIFFTAINGYDQNSFDDEKRKSFTGVNSCV